MKLAHWISVSVVSVAAAAVAGVLIFTSPALSQNQRSGPSAQSTAPQGMGMMGGKGMMAGGMMGGGMTGEKGKGMPADCPCMKMGMGMGMMIDTDKNPKMTAQMLEMRAEMMKADAAIMEKYAHQMAAGK